MKNYSIFIPVGHRNFFPRLFGCTDFVDSIYSVSDIIQYLFPLVIGTSSLVYSDAPTSSTASTRSVTFGFTFLIQIRVFPLVNIEITL